MANVLVLLSVVVHLGFAIPTWKAYRKNSTLLSPLVIWWFTWCLSFVLATLHLATLAPQFGVRTLVLVTAITAISGGILTFMEFAGPPAWTLGEALRKDRTDWRNGTTLLILLLATLAISSLVYIVEFKPLGGNLPVFGFDPAQSDKPHRVGKDSPLQIVAGQDYLVGALCFVGAIRTKGPLRAGYLFLAAVPVLTGILKLSRSDVLEALFAGAVIWAVLRIHRSTFGQSVWKALSIPAGFFLLWIGGASTNLRLKYLGAQNYADLIGFGLRSFPSFVRDSLAWLYGYTSLNFANLDLALREPPFMKFGLSGFRPLFTISGRGDSIDAFHLAHPTPSLSGVATVGTYARDLYMEGGIAGVLLFSAIYAALLASSWLWLRTRPGIISLFSYVTLIYPFFFLFFQNAFANFIQFAAGWLGILVLAQMLPRRQRRGFVG